MRRAIYAALFGSLARGPQHYCDTRYPLGRCVSPLRPIAEPARENNRTRKPTELATQVARLISRRSLRLPPQATGIPSTGPAVAGRISSPGYSPPDQCLILSA